MTLRPMRLIAVGLFSIVCVLAHPAAQSLQEPAPGGPVLIHAARLIDGRGRVLDNATIEVRGSRIVAVDQRKGPFTYDLGAATLLPGMIDVHVHIGYHFSKDGRYNPRDEPADARAVAIGDNLRATLLAGFTTVQSVGEAADKALREGTAAGTLDGPRILSSLGSIQGGTPEAIRQRVQTLKANGADLIKIFASGSGRDGGQTTLSPEQLAAACGEAKAQGLRSMVHAHRPDAIIASVSAGCTEVEHGIYADAAAIRAMAAGRVYFDPNIGLVRQNYLEHRDLFAKAGGNFDDAGFAMAESQIPIAIEVFKKALAAGLRMPMGTDAVGLAHGQNARETIVRVKDGGERPMDAIIGTTSLAAESLGLDKVVGTLAPGYEADLIAVGGNPLVDIGVLRGVRFVMKGGRVYKK
jgi:imidazolonepropionase-like amidohydrolase